MMTKKQINKPFIESLINTAAMSLMAMGVVMLQAEKVFGFPLIVFGLGMEWFKYWGRRKYW